MTKRDIKFIVQALKEYRIVDCPLIHELEELIKWINTPVNVGKASLMVILSLAIDVSLKKMLVHTLKEKNKPQKLVEAVQEWLEKNCSIV